MTSASRPQRLVREAERGPAIALLDRLGLDPDAEEDEDLSRALIDELGDWPRATTLPGYDAFEGV